MHQLFILIAVGLVVAACATDGSRSPGSGAFDIATRTPGHPALQTSEYAAPLEQGILVERRENMVLYRGGLTEKGLEALRSIGNDPGVTTLLIDSTGGEIVLGMQFGDWVIDRELDVVIDRACLSSCANYIFTAGRNKKIMPGAVVAWHGSAKQPGLLDQLNELVEEQIASRNLSPAERQRALKRAHKANVAYLTAAIYRQDRFFFRVGVDEYVTRIGNDKYGVRGFFYLSVPDMATFGINQVTAADNYAEMEPNALSQRVGFPVTLVELK